MNTKIHTSIGKFFKPYISYIIVALILVTLGVVAELLIPLMTKTAIDRGIADQNTKIIIISGSLIIGFALIRGIFTNLANVSFTITSTKVTRDIRQKLFNHITNLSFAEIDQLQTGKLMTRIYNDTYQLRTLFSFGFRMLFQGILMIIGSLYMIFTINHQIGFVIIILAAINASLFSLFALKAKNLFLIAQQQLDKLNSTIQQNLAGISVVKSFVAEDQEISIFNEEADRLKDQRIQVGKLLSAAFPTLLFVVNFGVLMVLWRGGADVIEGSMDIGALIALINYIFMIMFPLMMLGMVITMFARASASAKRIKEILELATSYRPSGKGKFIENGSITIEHLDFSYPNRTKVICDLNLDIKSGEVIGIIGSTGSGKSTLLNLIAGFYQPSSGTIKIDGYSLDEIGIENLRQNINIVFQDPMLFKMSLFDNISFASSAGSDEILKSAEIAQINTFINQLPSQFNTEIKNRGTNLSGGQRQRVAIARSLIGNKPILILDDAFSSLDRITENRLIDQLLDYRKGKTTLIISQKISSVRKADRIALLEQGKISVVDNHQNLLRQNKTYQEIYISQGYEL
ncbi:MAG: ABC transporter ATP-binding protein [bacterium]